MSSSPPPPSEAEVEAVRREVALEVAAQIRAAVEEVAIAQSLTPEGLPGHIEMAMGVERGPLVVDVLRQVAESLERLQKIRR